MFVNSETNRINYANAQHHRQLIRKQIDPRMITQIETDINPSKKYQNAFKGVYQDQLEKTVEEHKEKKRMQQAFQDPHQQSLYQQPYNNSGLYQSPSPNKSMSMSRLQTFHDYEEELGQKKELMIQKQLQKGSILFNAQDAYQQKKRQELQATNAMLRMQLEQKQQQQIMKMEEGMKENYEVKENRRRQLEYEMMKNMQSKEIQSGLRHDLLNQIEHERVKRHHKSIINMNNKARHNPITNPIEYHIENPYILCAMQKKENSRYY